MTPHLIDTPVLETERLVLRAPGKGDWEPFRDFILSDRAEFVRTADIDVAKAWRAYGHIVGMWVLRGFGSFVYCLKGSDAPLGHAGPWYPEGWPEREIGWTVWRADAEGRGYAREAARATIDHVFRDLGWETAVSYIDPGNTRSIRLAERLGALLDPSAPAPEFDDAATLVYRHPLPGDQA